jgi:pseudaminic acid synthase
MNTFQINGREIGKGHKTYIIAELSCNHNQDKSIALKLIDEAHKAGANAIKLQTYTPDTMTIKSNKSYFTDCLKGSIWEGQTLYDLYSIAYTPWEWTKELKDYANKLGMDLFSSPFDSTAVDYLEKLDIPAYKIASFEIVDHVLIKKIAQTGKPVIISSGMASKEELEEAVHLLRDNGCTQICMLKCTSAYPAKPQDANLITIKNMMESFNVVGGLSDHTLGIEVPIAAVTLGASIIEKHFTLSRESGSPDDAFSLTPDEFKQMVDSVRIIEKTIGNITYGGVKKEGVSKKFRKSLFIVKDMKKGEKFTKENLRPIRPGYGLHTKHYWDILGKECNQDIEYGTPMKLKNIKLDILFLTNEILFAKFNLTDKLNTLKIFNIKVIFEKITFQEVKNYDFIISFGYKHIIKKPVIDYFKKKIINCHISYLPYNRGSDPNLWSVLDKTPSGITIHILTEKLDQGDIIIQEKINISEEETLSSSYNILIEEMIKLLNNNILRIIDNKYTLIKQNDNLATYHELKDRPDLNVICPLGWNTKIKDIKY